jgi:RimJ/RimL family protein N-acetyltransferase
MALLPDVIPVRAYELRRWHPAQVDAAMAAIEESRPELEAWMPWAPGLDRDAEMATVVRGAAEFDADRNWPYMLCDGDEVLGSLGVHDHRADGYAEIGYWIRTGRTRRGLATSSAAALTAAAFAALPDIGSVVICMDKANLASAAVPPKLGYVLDREETRPIDAPAQSGEFSVWIMERARWAALRSVAWR